MGVFPPDSIITEIKVRVSEIIAWLDEATKTWRQCLPRSQQCSQLRGCGTGSEWLHSHSPWHLRNLNVGYIWGKRGKGPCPAGLALAAHWGTQCEGAAEAAPRRCNRRDILCGSHSRPGPCLRSVLQPLGPAVKQGLSWLGSRVAWQKNGALQFKFGLVSVFLVLWMAWREIPRWYLTLCCAWQSTGWCGLCGWLPALSARPGPALPSPRGQKELARQGCVRPRLPRVGQPGAAGGQLAGPVYVTSTRIESPRCVRHLCSALVYWAIAPAQAQSWPWICQGWQWLWTFFTLKSSARFSSAVGAVPVCGCVGRTGIASSWAGQRPRSRWPDFLSQCSRLLDGHQQITSPPCNSV